MALNARQETFVAEYLVDCNATAAAVRSGYSARGANVHATRLLANPEIQTAIQVASAARAARIEVTADQVVAELTAIVFGDPREVVTWGPGGVSVKDSEELTASAARMVQEVSETTTTTKDGAITSTVKVKLRPRDPALSLLAKHLGLIPVGGLSLSVPGDEAKVLVVMDGGPRGGR